MFDGFRRLRRIRQHPTRVPRLMLSTLDRPTAPTRPGPLTDGATSTFTALVTKLDAELRAAGRRS